MLRQVKIISMPFGLKLSPLTCLQVWHSLMLLCLKMNATKKVTIQYSTFRHSRLVSSSGVIFRLVYKRSPVTTLESCLRDSFYTVTNERLFL